MENADATVKEEASFAMFVQARNACIYFQLPVLQTRVRLQMIPIFTKTGLVARVNQLLASHPRLVMPGGTSSTNWKLTNYQGELINIQSWDAMQYANSTIMVSFDHEFANGEVQASPWEVCQFGEVFTLHYRGGSSPEGKILRLPRIEYRAVHVRVHRRSADGKTWQHWFSEVVAASHNSTLDTLTHLLPPQQNVWFRVPPSDTLALEAGVYFSGSQKFVEIRNGNVATLDMLVH